MLPKIKINWPTRPHAIFLEGIPHVSDWMDANLMPAALDKGTEMNVDPPPVIGAPELDVGPMDDEMGDNRATLHNVGENDTISGSHRDDDEASVSSYSLFDINSLFPQMDRIFAMAQTYLAKDCISEKIFTQNSESARLVY